MKKRPTKRDIIEAKIILNEISQKRLYNENLDLKYKLNNLREKGVRFEDKVTLGKKKKSVSTIVRWRYWMEDFKDEDTGEVLSVERAERIAIDGKPCNPFGIVYGYYDLKSSVNGRKQ